MVVVVRLPNTAHESSLQRRPLLTLLLNAYIYAWNEEWNSRNHLVYWKSFRFGHTNTGHSTARAHTHLQQMSKTILFLMMPKPGATIHSYTRITLLFIFCVRFLYFVLFLHLLNSFLGPPSFRRTRKYGRTDDLSAIYIRSKLNRHLKRRIKFYVWILCERSPYDVSFLAIQKIWLALLWISGSHRAMWRSSGPFGCCIRCRCGVQEWRWASDNFCIHQMNQLNGRKMEHMHARRTSYASQ